jgi:hypothetical protein
VEERDHDLLSDTLLEIPVGNMKEIEGNQSDLATDLEDEISRYALDRRLSGPQSLSGRGFEYGS